MSIPQSNAHIIAGVRIPSRFSLAPLAGYSDFAMRLFSRRFGAGLTYTEMVSVTAIARKIKKTYPFLKRYDAETCVAAQLYGGRVDDIPAAVENPILRDFDFIDLNMGCPVKKVVRSGGGAAMLLDVEKMRRATQLAVENSPVPVSVKIRLGYHVGGGGELERALAIEDAGASFVAVHGRYQTEFFKPDTMHLDFIARIKEALAIPVIGNGDVLTPDDARRMFAETNVDGIMIGRGAVGNPWIFGELNYALYGDAYSPPTRDDVKSVMLEHLGYALEHYPRSGVSFMRKFFMRYMQLLGVTKARKIELMQLDAREDVESFIRSL